MRHPLTRRPRRGFTLVELLVACALTVLIMAVLATAFQTGLSTFSHLKSTVGLSEQLRAAEAIIRRDLEATHLETGDGVALKVSALGATPPTRGYLEVVQATPLVLSSPVPPPGTPYVVEGTEDTVTSCRATDHAVFFTSKLKGNSPQEVFVGQAQAPIVGDPELADYAPAGSFVGQWAEIGLFLAPSLITTIDDGVTAGTQLPLYSLYRRQRVLATSAQSLPLSGVNSTPLKWRDANSEASISTQIFAIPGPSTEARVNDPVSVMTRTNRLGYVATNTGSAPTETAILPDATPAPLYPFTSIRSGSPNMLLGTDILVTNVVSMQIRVMDGTGVFQNQLPPGVGPSTGFRLDTANPANPQMRAIQIKLRVYDTKNHMTRQTTMTFDL